MKFPSVALILCVIGLPAQAGVWSAETDPATFIFHGYALHVRYQPAAGHWRYGAGAYSLHLPQPMVQMYNTNSSKHWQLNLDAGLGLFTEYYFRAGQNGWYTGGQLATQRFTLDRRGASHSERFSQTLAMLQLGYRWYPGSHRYYLQPWFGLGYARRADDATRLDGVRYAFSDIMAFMTVHLGFDL